MTRRSIRVAEKEMDKSPQNPRANTQPLCPLAPNKGCQQGLWCHDRNLQVKALVRDFAKKKARETLPDNESLRLERACAVRLAHAKPDVFHAAPVLRRQNQPPLTRAQFANGPKRAIRSWLIHQLGLPLLHWLVLLQVLGRLRCWLLRTFLCPLLVSLKKKKGNDIAGREL